MSRGPGGSGAPGGSCYIGAMLGRLYEEHVLPHVTDRICGTGPIEKQREKIVPRAEGDVLEVGFGSGYNLAHYERDRVGTVWALEPSEGMRRRAEPRVRASGMDVRFLDLPGERIPLDDDSVDTVVVTYTLCSIPDVRAALLGMRRVLRPGGRLLFCEHGAAPEPEVQRWQRRITPLWKRVGGGCRLDRPIPGLIEEAGFHIEDLETMYLPHTLRILGFNYWGQAV